ncbi:MAG TPA: DUF1566 domain-containing protein [Polyangiaceae bacterium]
MLRTRGVIGVSWLLACCGGRSASDADLRAAGGGNAGNAVAGAAELGGAVSAGGASTSAGGAPTLTAGAPSLGGTSAGGAPVAGSANTAGADSAGAAGIEDDGGAGPVLDYSRARWPMPNSVSSGLPHPVSFDLSSPDVAKDKVTGLVWQRTIKAYGVTMDEGANYCSQLSLAGHRDWQLPSRIELISLFAAADQSDPNTNGFPISGGFISSSLYWGIPQIPLASPSVWRVNVNNGFLGPADASVPGTAICVRLDEPRNADPAPPARLLTADMVADTGTGLFWERTPGSGWNTYDVVKAYCDGLSLGGYDDWRMPSIVEMLTISDPAQLWPAINTTDFPGDENIESGWFWSATPYRMPTPSSYAPGLNFGGLYVNSQGATFPLLVRCVR